MIKLIDVNKTSVIIGNKCIWSAMYPTKKLNNAINETKMTYRFKLAVALKVYRAFK